MKRNILLFSSLVLLFGLGISSASAEDKTVERIHPETKYSDVEPSGWNLHTGNIVVRSMGEDPDTLNSWNFGRVDIGVVSELSLQVRDIFGMLPAKFTMRHGSIYVEVGAKKFPIATVGASDSGDEDTGRDGQNVHWKLDFIPGVRVVREDSRALKEYSLFLTFPFEHYVHEHEACSAEVADLGKPAVQPAGAAH